MKSVLPLTLLIALATAEGSVSAAEQSAPAAPAPNNAELSSVRELLEESQLDVAERAAREYIAHHPRTSEGHFLLGLILFRQVQSIARSTGGVLTPGDIPTRVMDANRLDQKIKNSLAAYTEGAKFGKPSASDLKIVSLDYILLEYYADADKWLSLVLEWNPGDAESWYYLGRTKYNENRFEEAIAAYKKCLELRPNYPLAANGMGLSYAGLNKIVEATSWLQKAIALQETATQKSPEPYIDLGELLNQQGRFADALPVLQKAVAIDSKNIRVHQMLGKTYLSLNRLDEAEHELRQAIILDDEVAAPHYLLGQIYRRHGDLAKAKSELERFEQLKAKEPTRKSGMQ